MGQVFFAGALLFARFLESLHLCKNVYLLKKSGFLKICVFTLRVDRSVTRLKVYGRFCFEGAMLSTMIFEKNMFLKVICFLL